MDRNQSRHKLGPVRCSADRLSKFCPRHRPQYSALAPRIVLLLALLLAPVRVFAGSVTLAWDPVVSPLLAGYNLYYGPSTGNYTTWINAGNATILTVPNLVDGATYYFAVTSYDWSGGSSAFSNEVAATIAYTGGGNYTGLWWAAPGASEDGWGLNIAHQGDTMFVTWFTYDVNRKGWWLVMAANRISEGVYSGTLLETRGPPFSTVPFNPTGAEVSSSSVGFGTLDFAVAGGSTFTYTVKGTTRTKAITRELLNESPLPACSFGTGNASAATNYTDLWWAAPARSEDGWGINLTHQGETIFATWFTYDVDGSPMWLVATAQRIGPGAYSGRLYRTTGTPYNATRYSGFVATEVGSLTLSFANGNSAMASYTISGVAPMIVTQTKFITRQTLVEPGTICQ